MPLSVNSSTISPDVHLRRKPIGILPLANALVPADDIRIGLADLVYPRHRGPPKTHDGQEFAGPRSAIGTSGVI